MQDPIIINEANQAAGVEKHRPKYPVSESGLFGSNSEGKYKQTRILAINSPTPLRKGIRGFLIPCNDERDNCRIPCRIRQGARTLRYVEQ